MCHINITYFFFQAEDGIRDYKVTGVQTCALPISYARCVLYGSVFGGAGVFSRSRPAGYPQRGQSRSEERRVGKEWRFRKHENRDTKKESKERAKGHHRENSYGGMAVNNNGNDDVS